MSYNHLKIFFLTYAPPYDTNIFPRMIQESIPGKCRVIAATSFTADFPQDSTILEALPSKLLSSSNPT